MVVETAVAREPALIREHPWHRQQPNHPNGPCRLAGRRKTLGSTASQRHAWKGWLTVQADSDPELNDRPLADEITLLGELVLAATRVTRHLTQAEVDRVLDLGPPVGEPPVPSG